ncbi:GNAT family N-acetyltransferase [Paenibacillus selenitireducens]|uniref:GNAT family N-acetyltransferase n=1 Tax=Paenibacillus selenitireducens TaxID=1324314 RepID=A0A1T2X5I1_9BACL|nr:GNAT family N-acetyltransferase [Paenibacillus selenitireducens]OPA75161.1 GNAT family N-acetyltransferase [Paenibacillus selenitireducens]
MHNEATVNIKEVFEIESCMDELSKLLVQVVDAGASIGFLPPLSSLDSRAYWMNVLGPDVILYVAIQNHTIGGTVQLHRCTKQNGSHRAEIAKLMTHPAYRRHGIGRTLMLKAEERARNEGISLLVLDTREGDGSNTLYCSMDYVKAGQIPNYARSANGQLHATNLFYKILE